MYVCIYVGDIQNCRTQIRPISESEQIMPNEFPVKYEDTGPLGRLALYYTLKTFPLFFLVRFNVWAIIQI